MIYSKGGSIPPIQPSNKLDYVISDEVIDATNSTEDFDEFVKTSFEVFNRKQLNRRKYFNKYVKSYRKA